MDAGIVGAAADPELAVRMLPEALDELPAVAAVARVEQAARDRAAPELAVALRRFERPDLHDVPRDRRVAHRIDVDDVVGLRRVRRDGPLFPGGAAVARALHLDAEVAHVLRGVQRAVALAEHHRHRVAEQLGALDAPLAAAAADDEHSFSCADEQLASHRSASRKSLKNIDFAVCINAIRELAAVFDVAAVDEHFDVMAHLALVVEHVAAHAGPASRSSARAARPRSRPRARPTGSRCAA